MEKQLEAVRRSYDQAIEQGRKGDRTDPYKNLPGHITNDPGYPLYRSMIESGKASDSGRREIREYLSPAPGMRFVDLGCCLNLMFRGYDQWPSVYYGVDISGNTITLLKEFAAKKNLSIGSFYCGSIHETPFEAGTFDIGACIGVLEYYDGEFARKAIAEAHRILKPNGRFVLDVPDLGSPECRIAMAAEAYLGRPGLYDMAFSEFEELLLNYFEMDGKEKVGPMVQYFLRRGK